MKTLVYLSTSRTMLSDAILMEILTSARKNNTMRNVTGVLLYSQGTFIQVLEGEEHDVDFIFSKIEKDVRHKNILTLMERELPERNFPTWSMGFTSVDKLKADDLINNLTTTEQILNNNSKDTSIAMLKTFIETNKLIVGF